MTMELCELREVDKNQNTEMINENLKLKSELVNLTFNYNNLLKSNTETTNQLTNLTINFNVLSYLNDENALEISNLKEKCNNMQILLLIFSIKKK